VCCMCQAFCTLSTRCRRMALSRHLVADGVGESATFNTSFGITCDTARNVAYASDFGNNLLRRWTLSNNSVSTSINVVLFSPYGIAHHNATDVLHVSDQKNSRLVKVVVATQNATVATNFDD
jgi:hypothetical protein